MCACVAFSNAKSDFLRSIHQCAEIPCSLPIFWGAQKYHQSRPSWLSIKKSCEESVILEDWQEFGRSAIQKLRWNSFSGIAPSLTYHQGISWDLLASSISSLFACWNRTVVTSGFSSEPHGVVNSNPMWSFTKQTCHIIYFRGSSFPNTNKKTNTSKMGEHGNHKTCWLSFCK